MSKVRTEITGAIECSGCALLRSLVDELRSHASEEREARQAAEERHRLEREGLFRKLEEFMAPKPVVAQPSSVFGEPRLPRRAPAPVGLSQPVDLMARIAAMEVSGETRGAILGRVPAPVEPPPDPVAEAAADQAAIEDVVGAATAASE